MERGNYSISLLFTNKCDRFAWWFTAVYGPNCPITRPALWAELNFMRSLCALPWVLAGDFNTIRFQSEKRGGSDVTRSMTDFSDFIESNTLVDLPLQGVLFTWTNCQTPPIMTRIDRILVSQDWLDVYPNVAQIALNRPTSDHTPLLLESFEEGWVHTGLNLCGFQFLVLWRKTKSGGVNFTSHFL